MNITLDINDFKQLTLSESRALNECSESIYLYDVLSSGESLRTTEQAIKCFYVSDRVIPTNDNITSQSVSCTAKVLPFVGHSGTIRDVLKARYKYVRAGVYINTQQKQSVEQDGFIIK